MAERNGGFVQWKNCAGCSCQRVFVPDKTQKHRTRSNRSSSDWKSQAKTRSTVYSASCVSIWIGCWGKTVLGDKLNLIRLFVSISTRMSDTCINSSHNGWDLINLLQASMWPAAEDRYESCDFREIKQVWNLKQCAFINEFNTTVSINVNGIIWAHTWEIPFLQSSGY